MKEEEFKAWKCKVDNLLSRLKKIEKGLSLIEYLLNYQGLHKDKAKHNRIEQER